MNNHSTISPNWPNDWAVLWVLIYTLHLTVCYYNVTFKFQSESTNYSFPEVQGTPCLKQVPYLKFKWQKRDSNPQPLSLLMSTQPFCFKNWQTKLTSISFTKIAVLLLLLFLFFFRSSSPYTASFIFSFSIFFYFFYFCLYFFYFIYSF